VVLFQHSGFGIQKKIELESKKKKDHTCGIESCFTLSWVRLISKGFDKLVSTSWFRQAGFDKLVSASWFRQAQPPQPPLGVPISSPNGAKSIAQGAALC
jgi:hypothetical protein